MGNIVVKRYDVAKEALRDSKNWFPKYKEGIEGAVQSTFQVIQYIRERCNSDLYEAHEVYDFMLDKIERDCRIYKSRIDNLDVRLTACYKAFSKAIASRAKSRDQQVADSLEVFLRWFDARRELHQCFKASNDEWLSSEKTILKALKQEQDNGGLG